VTAPAVEDGLERETRLAAYAVCADGDRLLLCRIGPGNLGTGLWTLPGGGVSFGEPPADAALRELLEETGLRGHIDGVADIYSRVFAPDELSRPRWLHSIGVLYRVAITGGELRDEPDGSTDRAAWLGPDERRTLPMGDLVAIGERVAFG
jgi:ADP-ribose pyrophosphatase YjhB (NUDIX family)